MATELKNAFEPAAERYVSANCLLKVILSGNKILAESGHRAILTIIENVISCKYLRCVNKECRLLLRIADEMKSKNTLLRSKCSQYLRSILSNYPASVLEKYANSLEDLIKIAVNDASPETRSTGRDNYLLYSQIFPTKAAALYAKFSASVQRALAETKNPKTSQASSGKSSAHKPSPTKRAKPKVATKDKYLSEDIPKTMYNSWKENTETTGVPAKTVGRSASSRRKQKGSKESAQTIPVTLKQVKVAKESGAENSDGESGCWNPTNRDLDFNQSGYEEQKGEEMASSIDEEEIGVSAEVALPKTTIPQLLHHLKLDVTKSSKPVELREKASCVRRIGENPAER